MYIMMTAVQSMIQGCDSAIDTITASSTVDIDAHAHFGKMIQLHAHCFEMIEGVTYTRDDLSADLAAQNKTDLFAIYPCACRILHSLQSFA